MPDPAASSAEFDAKGEVEAPRPAVPGLLTAGHAPAVHPTAECLVVFDGIVALGSASRIVREPVRRYLVSTRTRECFDLGPDLFAQSVIGAMGWCDGMRGVSI